MSVVLVINGPNLNRLGARDPALYGDKTLDEINGMVASRAKALGLEPIFFQSNSEGALIDLIQSHREAAGIVINPGALTHYGHSLREALVDTGLPVIEVHLSHIHAREEWRRVSVIAPVCRAQISGLGWRGYLHALEALADMLKERA